MKTYAEMSREELLSEKASLEERYNEFKARGLKLDMSRGKPCKEQLDLSVALNDVADYVSDGVDVRNYGMLDGIPSCKKLFADLMGVKPENVIVGPTSSLNLMFGASLIRLNFFAPFRDMTAISQFLSISELK